MNRHGSCGSWYRSHRRVRLECTWCAQGGGPAGSEDPQGKLLELQSWVSAAKRTTGMKPVDLDRVVSDYALVASRLDIADRILDGWRGR